jgi:hypothetical protein
MKKRKKRKKRKKSFRQKETYQRRYKKNWKI